MLSNKLFPAMFHMLKLLTKYLFTIVDSIERVRIQNLLLIWHAWFRRVIFWWYNMRRQIIWLKIIFYKLIHENYTSQLVKAHGGSRAARARTLTLTLFQSAMPSMFHHKKLNVNRMKWVCIDPESAHRAITINQVGEDYHV
jgi:hypothetical protein